MILFLLLLLVIGLYKLNSSGKTFYKSDYISREQTLSINGLFMAFILMSHTFAKCSNSNVFNDIFGSVRIYLGQFVVVPILFFSGYGIIESVKHKRDYIKAFPKQRLLNIYLKFAIISLIYVIINLIWPLYGVERVILSFTGLISIGNGGWYVWATLIIYVFIIASFNLFKNKIVWAVASTTVLTAALTVLEMLFDFPTYYYSTMIFMPIGMCFSIVKGTFDRIVMKNNFIWALSLFVSIALSVIFNILADKSFVFFPVWCFFGMIGLLIVCMKFKMNSPIVKWIGQTSFLNFLLQGIPQRIFGMFITNDWLYYVLVFVVTFILIAVFDAFLKPIDKVLKK